MSLRATDGAAEGFSINYITQQSSIHFKAIFLPSALWGKTEELYIAGYSNRDTKEPQLESALHPALFYGQVFAMGLQFEACP